MKIGIAGCTGRMGLTLCRVARDTPGCTLSVGSVRPDTDEMSAHVLLATVGAGGLPLVRTARELAENAEAIIDFTAPEVTVALAKATADAGVIHVIGTTGLTPKQREQIRAAAASACIIESANFSLGVNVMEALIEKASRLLNEDYDIEIDEIHHRMKKDAPSGTALQLAAAAARGRGISLKDKRVHYGEGYLGERMRGTIGMSVRRGGEVIGDHTVTLAGPGERLELTHRAQNRDIYAHGALKAALWGVGKPPGLYTMRDVLGL